MDLLSKKNEYLIRKILETLSNGTKLKSFTQLHEASAISRPTLSNYLKILQEKKMITKDIQTRKYMIEKKGNDYLRKNDAANTIKDGAVIEKTELSLPANSIVAIDIPNSTKEQQDLFVLGTVKAAAACFNQFHSDMQKMGGKLPANGRITYSISMNLNEVNKWLDSEQGKDYLKKNQK